MLSSTISKAPPDLEVIPCPASFLKAGQSHGKVGCANPPCGPGEEMGSLTTDFQIDVLQGLLDFGQFGEVVLDVELDDLPGIVLVPCVEERKEEAAENERWTFVDHSRGRALRLRGAGSHHAPEKGGTHPFTRRSDGATVPRPERDRRKIPASPGNRPPRLPCTAVDPPGGYGPYRPQWADPPRGSS